MSEVRKDPPMREDGRCALPGCKNELPPVGRKNLDPFCSATCCRKWWRVDDPPKDVGR